MDSQDRIYIYIYIFSLISLIADGPHHYHPACGHKGSSHLSPIHALQFFLSRCKFSTLTTRQQMVEFYLLTFPRFPLRRKEHKFYFGKNRTHDFRTSRCAGYLLDHLGKYMASTNSVPLPVATVKVRFFSDSVYLRCFLTLIRFRALHKGAPVILSVSHVSPPDVTVE